jgi:hypothetical protein
MSSDRSGDKYGKQAHYQYLLFKHRASGSRSAAIIVEIENS